MKIGIDARPLISRQPSGIGTYLIHVLRYISAMDKQNEYYLYSHQEMEYPIELGENFYKRVIPGKVGTLWLRYVLPKHLKKDGIDVFWGTQHFLPCRVKGMRTCLTIHDTALLIQPKWGSRVNSFMQNTFLRSSAREADLILTVSHSTKRDTVRLCGVSEEKIVVTYEGCPESLQQPGAEDAAAIRKKFGMQWPYYLYVGTIEPRKNIETMIAAFEILAKDDPEARLVLAGGLGWRYEGILQAVEQSPYKDRICMPGYLSVQEKHLLYSEARAFLFPSHYEGFGLPILEAYRTGTQVITARNSSLPEVGGEAAWYIDDENDANALAQVMAQVAAAPQEELQRRSALGNTHCDSFSWEACAKQTMALLLNK